MFVWGEIEYRKGNQQLRPNLNDSVLSPVMLFSATVSLKHPNGLKIKNTIRPCLATCEDYNAMSKWESFMRGTHQIT